MEPKQQQVPDAIPEALVAEHGRRAATAFRAEALGQLGVSEQSRQGIRQPGDIVGFDEKASLAVGNDLGDGPRALGDHRQTCGSGFDVDESEPFSLRRVDRRPRGKREHGGSRIEPLKVGVSDGKLAADDTQSCRNRVMAIAQVFYDSTQPQ